MSKAVAVVLAACALFGAVSAADRKLLQSNYLGYVTRTTIDSPQDSRFGVGFATSASGPAQFSDKVTYTGPNPPSAAFAVNPTGGFAEYKDTTRFDYVLPRYSGVGRASTANTWAADLSAGGRILPDIQSSTKIRPTMPLTFPVFNFGGSVLPTYQESTVINPRSELVSGVVPPPPAPKGKEGGAKAGGKAGAKAGAKAGGDDGGDKGGDAKGGDDGGDRRRRLLNWGHEDSTTFRASSFPQFKYATNPPPAVIASRTAVAADKVNLDAGAKIPGNLVTVTGNTAAVFGPQRPFPVGGKGDWTVVNLSRGPSTVVHAHDAAINWGAGGAVLNNGNPLNIAHTDAVLVPNRNHYTGFAFTPQLGDRPDGFIEHKSRTTIPIPKRM